MRYLFGFLCVCALVATPLQGASAQTGEEGGSRVDTKSEPPSTSTREGYSLSFWHDEALKIALFSSPGYSLEYVTKTEDGQPRARRGMRIGVGVSGAVVVVVAVLAGAAVASRSDL